MPKEEAINFSDKIDERYLAVEKAHVKGFKEKSLDEQEVLVEKMEKHFEALLQIQTLLDNAKTLI